MQSALVSRSSKRPCIAGLSLPLLTLLERRRDLDRSRRNGATKHEGNTCPGGTLRRHAQEAQHFSISSATVPPPYSQSFAALANRSSLRTPARRAETPWGQHPAPPASLAVLERGSSVQPSPALGGIAWSLFGSHRTWTNHPVWKGQIPYWRRKKVVPGQEVRDRRVCENN